MACLATTFVALTTLVVQADDMAIEPGRLDSGVISSDMVSDPVEYYALLPPGYDTSESSLPLLLVLHGGGGAGTI